MGRELRMVPPNWEHPKKCDGRTYEPLFDGFENILAEFEKDIKEKGLRKTVEHWCEGPNPECYVEYKEEDATWYQLYENVSEGTPITPPFETKEELVDYLVENGDFWEYSWDREAAENIVGTGYAPSMIMAGGKTYAPNEQHLIK